MSFFPALFIGTLAFCHVYTFWRFDAAFPKSRWRHVVLEIMLVGLISIFLRRHYAKMHNGDVFINLTFAWLGFMAVMAIVLLCRDLAFLLLKAADRILKTGLSRRMAGPKSIRLALAAGVLAFGYGVFEARQVRVERLAITTERLPPGVDRLRVVAVSDVHLTARGDAPRLRRLVELINRQKPDVTVMLGDLVDDWIVDRPELWEELGKIESPMGKLAILGNHEIYNGIYQSMDFIAKAGFRLLRGEAVEAGPICVVGVDDPAVDERIGIDAALARAGADRFILLLTHRPERVGAAAGLFDVQLSGHTHGGQLRPARLVSWLMFRKRQGLNVLHVPQGPGERRSVLYLTNGAGYWGPPVRFLAPPEIVVLDLAAAVR